MPICGFMHSPSPFVQRVHNGILATSLQLQDYVMQGQVSERQIHIKDIHLSEDCVE